MIDTNRYDECCGCQACKLICPVSAINMKTDEKGFVYPKINKSLCVKCNFCEMVCDFKKHDANLFNVRNIYALQTKDQKVLFNSTSGGAFTVLSDYILKLGGCIVGTILDQNLKAKYIVANTIDARNKMRGSKYIQSETNNIFREVYDILKNEKYVLFVGTPCYVGALKSYLNLKKVNLSKLYTVDFICHGVPSQKIFDEHLKYLSKKYKSEVIDYQFRDKKYGWCHTETATFSNNKRKSTKSVYQLKELFQGNINLRDSCYNCSYSNKNRPADITIGDYWDADRMLNKYDFKGTSLVLTNTKKGEEFLFNAINQVDKLYFLETSFHPLKQGGLNRPVSKSKQTDDFWNTYFKYGYEFAINKYAKISNKYMAYIYVKRVIHYLHLDSFFIRVKLRLRGE